MIGRLVSIVGKAQVGKDTVGSYMVNKLNMGKFRRSYRTIAFADELKHDLMVNFDLSHEQLYSDVKELPDKRYIKSRNNNNIIYWTPREIMQHYGQSMRKIDSNIWIRKLMSKISNNTFINYIITDVRHVNELKAVRDRNSLIIRVNRGDSSVVHGMGHISEVDLDNYGVHPDFIIDNNNDFKNLYKQIDSVIEFIEKENKNG